MDLTAVLHQAVEHHSDDVALVEDARRWTYASWYARIKRFAQSLAELGVRSGDRVAMNLPPSENYLTTFFATQSWDLTPLPHLGGREDANPLMFLDRTLKGRHYRAPNGRGGSSAVKR